MSGKIVTETEDFGKADVRNRHKTKNSENHLNVLPSSVPSAAIGSSSHLFPFFAFDSIHHEWFIFKIALFSRLFNFALQVLICYFVSDYDTSARMLSESLYFDKLIVFLFGGFGKWDAVYFLRISQYGYEQEHYFGFFPAVPLMTRAVSYVLEPLFCGLVTPELRFLVAGTLVSNINFVLSALVFYRLSLSVLREKNGAFQAAILYCFNPASIFMSAVYSESSFALFTFAGMYYISLHQLFLSAFFFSLSCATRGNGLINLGFLAYEFLLMCTRIKSHCLKNYLSLTVRVLFAVVLAALPFVLFQVYGYYLYCYDDPSKRPWCTKRIPVIYSFVQEYYWYNGFLSYYQLKQIPNFLLALPMVIFSILTIYKYLMEVPYNIKNLGLWDRDTRKGFFGSRVFVYMVYMAFLTLFCCFFMYIQVMTRFISASCPPLYWLYSVANSFEKKSMLLYFSVYIMLGLVLHCNFYPWT